MKQQLESHKEATDARFSEQQKACTLHSRGYEKLWDTVDGMAKTITRIDKNIVRLSVAANIEESSEDED